MDAAKTETPPSQPADHTETAPDPHAVAALDESVAELDDAVRAISVLADTAVHDAARAGAETGAAFGLTWAVRHLHGAVETLDRRVRALDGKAHA